ncbi:hypothetical protein NPIL_392581 [Nephila pilipes]|uniref:Uncharacterized protein n=1 Tax=Nephila pilipes TaxID=299642 RepID=A0A8X6N8T0_NEPPI|nr:hypothetical protein NPIL_392581 [Nephila pilipes]
MSPRNRITIQQLSIREIVPFVMGNDRDLSDLVKGQIVMTVHWEGIAALLSARVLLYSISTKGGLLSQPEILMKGKQKCFGVFSSAITIRYGTLLTHTQQGFVVDVSSSCFTLALYIIMPYVNIAVGRLRIGKGSSGLDES